MLVTAFFLMTAVQISEFFWYRRINPPASLQTGQVVKVTKLDMSETKANEVTVEAIFDRYQCTELNLDWRIPQIRPGAFSKLTALEVLTTRDIDRCFFFGPPFAFHFHEWLGQTLDHCKNLKSLKMDYCEWTDLEMSDIVKHLPISLEKLSMVDYPVKLPTGDYVFELLAEYAPNLKDLGLCPTKIQCPSLLKFQFLEVLRFCPWDSEAVSSLCMNLIQFPALKTIYAEGMFPHLFEVNVPMLRAALEPHGIIVEMSVWYNSKDENNLWIVSNTM